MAIVYQTFNRAEANRLVHVTSFPEQADLWVFSVNYVGGHKGDYIWYFTTNRAEATSRIYLCSIGECQTIVHFVDRFSDAGWRKSKRFVFF